MADATAGSLERVFQRSHLRAPESQEAAGPSQQEEYPEEFYNFTAEDYYRLKGNKPGEAVLRTRAMREQDERERRARFGKARIRIQFPDLFVVEASFPSEATVDTLYSFVSTLVRPESDTWHLFTAPPKQRLSDRSRTLWDAGLVPQAQVFWASDKSDVTPREVPETESSYLQKWVTDRREEIRPAAVPEAGEEDAREAARKRAAMQDRQEKRKESEGGAKALKSKPKWLKM